MSTTPTPVFTDDDVIHGRGPKRLAILRPIYLTIDGKPRISHEPKVVPPPATTTNSSDISDFGRPLASARRHPEAHYPQHQCPICDQFIATREGADYIGHLNCRHRGTCPRAECMLAYYGRTDKWVGIGIETTAATTTYNQRRSEMATDRLFCQAPGCKEEIEAWCLVRAKLDVTGAFIMAVSTHEPAVEKAWEEAVARVEKRRKEEDRRREKERKREMRRGKKEERKEEREKRKGEKGLFGEIWGWTSKLAWPLFICVAPMVAVASPFIVVGAVIVGRCVMSK